MKKAILFGVLNWGLGHATRSIPIIRSLLRLQYEVVICSDGDALLLLQKEFPQIEFVSLPAYKVRYEHKSMLANMARYGIGLLKTIHQEQELLKKLVQQYKPAYIISDNRYGFYHDQVKSIIITHQLHIPTDRAWQGRVASQFLHTYIAHFDACWVPDFAGDQNLSGKLSHGMSLATPIQYIGPLSRLAPLPLPYIYDVAFVLSGPEPQRSRLEKLIVEQQLVNKRYSCVLVRGTQLPAADYILQDATLQVFDLVDSDTLQRLIGQSRLLVSRAGYTTIMDLVSMRRTAVLIPTPGQPEQEYLAQHLSQQFQGFDFVEQRSFDLSFVNNLNTEWTSDIDLPVWSDEHLRILLTTV